MGKNKYSRRRILMVTWDELDDNISLTLKDATYSSYPIELRMDAANWALSTIAWYLPVQSTIAISSGERDIDFPDDLIEVVSVWDGVAWCQPVNFGTDNSGSIVNPEGDSAAFERSFWLFGNKVNLTRELTADGILFYHAKYPDILLITDTIDIPRYAFQPLLYMTLAYCLHPNIATQGILSVWQEDVETGLSTPQLRETYAFYVDSAINMLNGIPMKNEEMSLLAIRRREYRQK